MSTPPSESGLKRAVRRLARPMLSPIDGRVADINSRVEWIGDRTEDALEAYARSESEASSYIGVELRRIHDLLAELGESLAAAVQLTERIVEVPFAMAALGRVGPGARVLDVGSAESTFALSAASLGYRVTAVDPRPLAYSHPNLESHALLLEDWAAPPASFDAAFLISTIEHVGLGAYGEPPYGEAEHGVGADADLLARVRAALAPEGLLVLTVPYGTRDRTDLERIYDEESLAKLLADWEILERRTAVRRGALVWDVGEDVEPGGRGVAMLIASPGRAADLTSSQP